MKRAILMKGLLVAVALMIVGVWLAQRTDAIIIVNTRPAVDTGMFGIGAGEVARVHVVNLIDPRSGIAPCTVEMQFLGARGELLAEIAKKILPGEADFFDFTDPTLRRPSRRHLRARVIQHPLPDGDPTPVCATTTEVFDGKTGQAGIIIVNSHPVP